MDEIPSNNVGTFVICLVKLIFRTRSDSAVFPEFCMVVKSYKLLDKFVRKLNGLTDTKCMDQLNDSCDFFSGEGCERKIL